jgi:hypothetical protein
MTRYQRKFLKLKKKEKGKVTFGDNVSAKILGKGIASLGNNKTKEKMHFWYKISSLIS